MPDILGTIANGFAGKNIVVIGDIVADQFLSGTISRVSREAPVFILRHDETATVPGAAANAAANIASLGGRARLIGVTGMDANATLLTDALRTRGVDVEPILAVDGVETTTKLRVLAARAFAVKQQVIRIDYEISELSDQTKDALRDSLASIVTEPIDAIIVSDYGLGVVSPELYADALEVANARGVPLVVDSRSRLNEFAGSTSATPNREEVEALVGENFADDDCELLRERLGCNALVITHGNQGLTVFEGGRPPMHLDAVGSTEPIDVTGAGDTVIAAYTLGLACGLTFAESASIANHAGGIVVMKKGTACVTPDELASSIAANDKLAATKQTSQ